MTNIANPNYFRLGFHPVFQTQIHFPSSTLYSLVGKSNKLTLDDSNCQHSHCMNIFLNQKKIMQPSHYIYDMNELVLRDL